MGRGTKRVENHRIVTHRQVDFNDTEQIYTLLEIIFCRALPGSCDKNKSLRALRPETANMRRQRLRQSQGNLFTRHFM